MFRGLGYTQTQAKFLVDDWCWFWGQSAYFSKIWGYVGMPLEEGTVTGQAKWKKENDLKLLLNWWLMGEKDMAQAKKNVSMADWKYFKELESKVDKDMVHHKEGGNNEDERINEATWDASLQKLRRFMHFFKWALEPEGKKRVFKENEQNFKDYDILQNFGYSSNECRRIRAIVNTRPEAKKH